MKKKLFIIIAAVIAVALVAGIVAYFAVNRGQQASGEDEFVPSAGKIDVGNLKDTKLTIYFEARPNEAMPEVLEAVNKKLGSDLKTELAFEMVYDYPENYYDRIKTAIASGEPCDAFYFHNYLPASLSQMAKEEIAADITKDFPKYAPDYFGQFSNDDLKAISIDNKIYAVPNRLPTAVRKCAAVREDLMTKYNIPEIRNYDDFEVYLNTVKEKEPQMIPLDYDDTTIGLFSEVNGYVVLDYQIGLVYKWGDPSMKLMAWEQTPGFADGINKIKSWNDKEYLTKNVGITPIDDTIITSGKWASMICNWGDVYTYNAMLALNGIQDYKYKAYSLNEGVSPRNSPLDNSLVISAKSKQADRVLMFIDWLESKQENFDLLMYGVKGKHYDEVGDYIVPTEAYSGQESFFNWGWKQPFRNIEYERVNYSGLKDEVARYNKEIMEKTKYPPHVGFVPDYSSVSDIVAIRRSEFNSLDKNIYLGSFQQEDVDAYIKQQKESGVQALVDEIQRQLDEYRQRK